MSCYWSTLLSLLRTKEFFFSPSSANCYRALVSITLALATGLFIGSTPLPFCHLHRLHCFHSTGFSSFLPPPQLSLCVLVTIYGDVSICPAIGFLFLCCCCCCCCSFSLLRFPKWCVCSSQVNVVLCWCDAEKRQTIGNTHG